MQIQTGQVLKHLESGIEAEYKAAIPTLAQGLLHLLVGPNGYLLKFSHELQQFELPNEVQAPVENPLQQITPADMQELLKLLREKQPSDQVQGQTVNPVEPGLEKVQTPEQQTQAVTTTGESIPL